MPRLYLLLVTLLTVVYGLPAQKWDYEWFFGSDRLSYEPGFGMSSLDFNGGQVTISQIGPTNFDMGPDCSMIADPVTGKIALFSNGCNIYNRNQEAVAPQSTLLNDWVSEDYCPHVYIGYHNNLLIPDLMNPDMFYLLQKDYVYVEELGTVSATQLLMHKVLRTDSGYAYLGAEQLLDTILMLGHLNATPNAARTAWWVSATVFRSNLTYMLEIGTEGEILQRREQAIGSISDNGTWDIGQATFSPDGRTWANSTEAYGIMLFDFDPATGELSNYREIHYPNMDTARGLAFSPSGQYIYVTSSRGHMYQVDWQSTDTLNRVVHLGHHYFPDATGWPVSMGFIRAGPDCRLYVSPSSSTNVFHVIHSPDEYGTACDFVPGAVEAPTRLLHHFPNLPNYAPLRPCDPTIAWGLPVATEEVMHEEVEGEVQLFPNPVHDRAFVTWSETNSYLKLELLSLDGKVLLQRQIEKGQNEYELSLSHLPAGVYFIRLTSKYGVQIGRVSKQ